MDSHNRPDVVTYRLGEKMVYVPPAKNYEQALDFAQREFAEDLRLIRRERISFSVLVNTGKNPSRRSVRIGAMAWPAVVCSLKCYEIIEVQVQPEVYVEHVDGPGYQLVVGIEDSKEAVEFYSHSTPLRTSGVKVTNDKHSVEKRGSKPFFRLK